MAYKKMMVEAIAGLANPEGSSVQAITKYIKGNYPDVNFKSIHLKKAVYGLADAPRAWWMTLATCPPPIGTGTHLLRRCHGGGGRDAVPLPQRRAKGHGRP